MSEASLFQQDPLSAAVKEQYERFPFPPLGLTALTEIRLPQADARFAFCYLDHPQPPALRILDAGCGTGFSTLKLAQANPEAEIVALELSEASLAIARKRLDTQAGIQAARVRFLQADLQSDLYSRYPDLGRFDYIHCSGVIHHIPEPERALKQLRHCLAPGGIFYLMVYAGAARHEIAAIQDVLQVLWRQSDDWQEGLMLCRQFLQNLPAGHPLKQHYLQSLQTVTELLGAEAAYSDAFLVDTYLQRCEWRWSQAQWFQVLDSAGWTPRRWLDEANWQPAPYLPTLPDKLAKLSEVDVLALVDRLRPPQNYALYLQAQPSAPGSLLSPAQTQQKYNAEARPQRFGFIQQPAAGAVLANARGQGLTLRPWMFSVWQALNGQLSWEQLWQQLQQEQHTQPIDQSSFVAFAQQLLKLYYVWQAPGN